MINLFIVKGRCSMHNTVDHAYCSMHSTANAHACGNAIVSGHHDTFTCSHDERYTDVQCHAHLLTLRFTRYVAKC